MQWNIGNISFYVSYLYKLRNYSNCNWINIITQIGLNSVNYLFKYHLTLLFLIERETVVKFSAKSLQIIFII